MIHITDKKYCCGCNACLQICPQQCISMKEDIQGFLYPNVEESLCVDCRMCENVCPVLNQMEEKKPLKVYAAKNKDEQIRLKSSSGGMFSLLAENILMQNGIVFGAKFNNNWEVEHGYVEDIKDLDILRRSKYIQSNIKDNYTKVSEFLKQERKVLFSGVPCQIAGLKNYLRKESKNLLCVDVVCHGVPSPRVWRDYLTFILQKNTNSFPSIDNIPTITDISFRDKLTGWNKYSFKILAKNGKNNGNNILICQTLHENVFMRGFLKDLYLREICYYCPAKNGKSHSDITLADFWGIQNVFPNIDDNNGVSAVLITTTKGEEIFNSLNVEKYETTYDKVRQVPMEQSVKEPKQRKEFWSRYEQEGVSCIDPICSKIHPNIIKRGIEKSKRIIKRFDNIFN